MIVQRQQKLYLFLFFITFATVVLFLWNKLHLGLVRYFDADELAYLHWAHNVYIGEQPYMDFFYYIPPGFLWMLVPLFDLVSGVAILDASRMVAFGIYVGICLVSGCLLRVLRGNAGVWQRLWYWVLPGMFLAFLPLPADKMLEIRPDNSAILFALIGLVFQIQWMSKATRLYGFLAGLFYSLSLLVLPKTFPQVVFACVIVLVWLFWGREISPKHKVSTVLPFILGLIGPFGVLGVWVLVASQSSADLSLFWYSLTKLPFEVSRIGEAFPMQPDLFFYPNGTYYGVHGWTRGLLTNHMLWIVGLLGGIYCLFTPHANRHIKHSDTWRRLLISGTMLVYIVWFMYGYTLRHAQYLIPIAIFVSLFVSDALSTFVTFLSKRAWGRIGSLLLVLVLVFYLGDVNREVTGPKFVWTNHEDKRILQTALDTIPRDAYVLDLVGATIYFKDPYYICCLPFGQYEGYMSKSFGILSQALEDAKTGYIYVDRLSRLKSLSGIDQRYIGQWYFPTSEGPFLLRK